MKLFTVVFLASVAAGFSSNAAAVDWSKLPAAAKTENVTFEKDILPLFKESCVRCHGAERPRAQLRLDTLEGALKGTKRGSIVTVGDSANSLLVKSISQLDPESAMPPKARVRRPGGPQGTNTPAYAQRLESIVRPAGTNAPAMKERGEGHEGGDGTTPRRERREGEERGFVPQGTNAPGQQRPRNFGPPAKPLTAEQVGLVRAWIDQGAK
jgi:mono/diheme cytochrome c family protein